MSYRSRFHGQEDDSSILDFLLFALALALALAVAFAVVVGGGFDFTVKEIAGMCKNARQQKKIRNLRRAIRGYERYVKYSKLTIENLKNRRSYQKDVANHYYRLAYSREQERRRSLRYQRIWMCVAIVLLVAFFAVLL